jgi:hypothetical protein
MAAEADVAAVLHAVEVNAARHVVGTLLRLLDAVGQRRSRTARGRRWSR